MDQITIQDLEVFWRIGVTPAERSTPQKLLLTIQLEVNTKAAAQSDDLRHTVDYFALACRIREWGAERSWNLLETLASQLAELILAEHKPSGVSVEIKKFVLPDAAYVSVKIRRSS